MRTSQESSSALLQEKKLAPRTQEIGMDTKESSEDERQLQTIDEAIGECRTLLRNPLFSDKTRREYDKMFDELRAKRKVEQARENIGYLIAALNQAESYQDTFVKDLDEAVKQQWISPESRARWWDRFNDPNTLEWARKEWLRNEFPEMKQRWKEAAEKRERIVALANEQELTAKEIPALANILNQKAFLSLHYLSRKDQLARAEALMKAHTEDEKKFLSFIEHELDDWADAGYMHPSKVGEWMNRVINSDDPKHFASTVLYLFKNNWKEARENFDELNDAMDAQGIPRGFRPVKENDFLLMNYKQRTSYCAHAWLRLENVEDENKELAKLKLRIRYSLDTKDWDDADEDVQKASAIRSDDRELQSMRTFLECHRAEAKEKKEKESLEPKQLLSNMRQMMLQIPAGLRSMYIQAFESSKGVAKRFLQVSGNHEWVVTHGYADEADNIKNAQSDYNKQKTREYVDHGHTRDFERNIIHGDTATTDAIRDDCSKAQMLYLGSDGQNALMEKIERNADNEQFGYWTTLVPMDVSYELHRRVIVDLHWPLKNCLNQLDALGYRFTMTGDLEKKAA